LDYIKLYNNLIVINNDPYILTDHISASGIINNMATNNAFLNNPPHFARNTTLTKFNSSGNRIWTTYLWSATGIQKTENNDIMTISKVSSSESKSNYTTQNTYQSIHGGRDDLYISIISNNGASL